MLSTAVVVYRFWLNLQTKATANMDGSALCGRHSSHVRGELTFGSRKAWSFIVKGLYVRFQSDQPLVVENAGATAMPSADRKAAVRIPAVLEANDELEMLRAQAMIRRPGWRDHPSVLAVAGHVRQAGGNSRLKLRRPRVQGLWWKVIGVRRGGRERDRRHGGLCCGRSAAIKPCAFGAPLRGCGA
jgi:hypothetical protein